LVGAVLLVVVGGVVVVVREISGISAATSRLHVTHTVACRTYLNELKVGLLVYDEITVTSDDVITSHELWYVDVPEGALLCTQVLAICNVSVQ
jgi:hypothetical protein